MFGASARNRDALPWIDYSPSKNPCWPRNSLLVAGVFTGLNFKSSLASFGRLGHLIVWSVALGVIWLAGLLALHGVEAFFAFAPGGLSRNDHRGYCRGRNWICRTPLAGWSLLFCAYHHYGRHQSIVLQPTFLIGICSTMTRA